MKSTIIIIIIVHYFCVAILPLTVYGSSSSDAEEITIDELYLKVCDVAEKEGKINNVFKPLKAGFLGKGGYSFTFRGILDSIDEEVAMKFTPTEDECNAEREFEVYTCLESINQTNKNAYGIPTVYYYGRWEGSIMMAITLLDSKLNAYQMNYMDILLIFREFVRISKYIHSRGICHNDLHIENLMFRKHQGFIIDYNLALNMYKPVWAERPEDFEGWISLDGRKCREKDWRKFFESMCNIFDFDVDYQCFNNTFHRITEIKHSGLRRVYFECAKFAFGGEPNHDKLCEIIVEEIERCKVPALVSWLTVAQKMEALLELAHNPIPPINSINDPPVQATEAHYIRPNFDFFVNQNS